MELNRLVFAEFPATHSYTITMYFDNHDFESMHNTPCRMITDAAEVYSERKLLSFLGDVMRKNAEGLTFSTHQYLAESTMRDGVLGLKIHPYLRNEYTPTFVSINEFKALLDIWLSEKDAFDRNPHGYRERIKETGGHFFA